MSAKTFLSRNLRTHHAGAVALALVLTVVAVIPMPAGAADADRGKAIFEKRCTGCHSLDIDKEGPRLGGIFGRAAGSVATFTYSDAVKKSRVTWDIPSLEKWLADPDAFIPDSNMAFRLVDADERSAIIAYLKQIQGK
jgi:cytochrome c